MDDDVLTTLVRIVAIAGRQTIHHTNRTPIDDHHFGRMLKRTAGQTDRQPAGPTQP